MQDKNVTSEIAKVLSGPGNSQSQIQPLAIVVADSAAQAGSMDASPGGSQNPLSEAIAQNTAQLLEVRSTLQSQLDLLAENTRALVNNTSSNSSGVASKIGGAVGSIASSMFGGGILGPIVSGLVGLFGGDSSNEAPAPLVKFALPGAVNVSTGVSAAGAGSVDYSQDGQPRMAGVTNSGAAQNITVNVSAMDSRSFLDHSSDIANAVRRAMLESNALNDVIGEM